MVVLGVLRHTVIWALKHGTCVGVFPPPGLWHRTTPAGTCSVCLTTHASLTPPAQTDVGDLLLLNHIPFAEDLRAYQFAPLPTPTTDATNAALQLIDTMDLSATEYVRL